MTTEILSSDSKPYYIYVLRCSDDSLYVGITHDIEHRIKAHLGIIKGGARYTKSHPVQKIESAWKAENKSVALHIECALKKLTRIQKLSIIDKPYSIYKYVTDQNSIEICSKDFLNKIFMKVVMNKK